MISSFFISSCLFMFIIILTIVLTPWITLTNKFSRTHKINKTQPNSHKLSQAKQSNNLIQLNIKNFNTRLAELEQDFATDTISRTQFINQKTDLQRQLINTHTIIETPFKISLIAKISLAGSIITLTTIAYIISDRASTLSFLDSNYQLETVADDLIIGKINQPPGSLTTTTEDIQVLITLVQKNVHQHAYDSQRWMKLSEIFISMNAASSAIQAMERANRINPNDADIAINYAKTSYFFNHQIMPKKAQKALKILLDSQPNHQGAIMLLIMSETRKGENKRALEWANKLKKSIQEKSFTAQDPTKYQTQLNSINKLIESIKNNQANNK